MPLLERRGICIWSIQDHNQYTTANTCEKGVRCQDQEQTNSRDTETNSRDTELGVARAPSGLFDDGSYYKY